VESESGPWLCVSVGGGGGGRGGGGGSPMINIHTHKRTHIQTDAY
jgi:hypothetical protein